MPSRHKVVKLRSKIRHASVSPLLQPEPQTRWQLDVVNACLCRGDETIALPPKAFAVLRYLSEHPGRLVTKQELLDVVWPDIAVTEAVLKNCILKLRHVLGDDAKAPRYIETVHWRGYRLLAPLPTLPLTVASSQHPGVSREDSESKSQESEATGFSFPAQDSALRTQHPVLVGRDTELTQLHSWLDKALNGERQLVFVTGEPGIGKTTVVNTFLDQLRLQDDAHGAETQVWLGLGQCIEHYGTGEAYLSVLTALGQLCREPAGKRFIRLLQQHAPAWLVQMPTLLTDEELAMLQRKTVGVTKERMLREIAEALEVMTQERPVVFVFEDLHWSDPSTLDLLAFVARRSQPARVLIIGTYRPAEVLTTEHPLRAVVQELQLHKQCEELRLEPLSKADVVAYLAQRIAMGAQPSTPLQDLASVIRQRTEGNPLFMVNVVDELLARRDLASATGEINVPATIRQMIERQFERLSPEDQSLIETASVTGIEFSAATVAAGNEAPVENVERHCTALARRGQFLHPAGISEWPDGTVASRYGFQHALYQEVIYDRVTAAQRIMLHRRIGERLETAYGKQAKEISAALAYHYGRSGSAKKAMAYLQLAGEQAVQRSANVEAINHFTTALELLKTLPDNIERTQQELTLQLALGIPLIATKGNAASEVGAVYTRARELCQQVGETPELFSTLMGLLAFYMMRAEVQTARELAEQSLLLAQCVHSPTRLMWAHLLLGQTSFLLGEFSPAQEHLEQGIALYNPQKHNPLVTGAVQDPGVSCLCFAALALRSLGYSDQAQQRSREALTLAQELSHPYSLAYALYYSAARLNQFRQEGQAAQEQAEAAIALSGEQGFPYWLAVGTILRGWALAEQGKRAEGISQMRQGLAALQAAGSNLDRSYYLAMLADAYGKAGQAEDGLNAAAEALAHASKTGESFYEAELYRLKGELTLAQEGFRLQAIGFREKAKEAEAYFHKAIDTARKQQAKSWELRATGSLARLWQHQGKKDEARQILDEIYGWFTEGFDTKDLQEAKALIEELSQ